MEKIIQPDQWDIIREAAIVIVGLIIRFLELRKIKKNDSGV
jgi:hypothetical protein